MTKIVLVAVALLASKGHTLTISKLGQELKQTPSEDNYIGDYYIPKERSNGMCDCNFACLFDDGSKCFKWCFPSGCVDGVTKKAAAPAQANTGFDLTKLFGGGAQAATPTGAPGLAPAQANTGVDLGKLFGGGAQAATPTAPPELAGMLSQAQQQAQAGLEKMGQANQADVVQKMFNPPAQNNAVPAAPGAPAIPGAIAPDTNWMQKMVDGLKNALQR